MKTGPTNNAVLREARALEKVGRKNKAGIWMKAAEALRAPRRGKKGVNVSKLEKFAKGDVVVLDKVLGSGRLSKALNIAAIGFTKASRESIRRAGGRCLSLSELAEKNPKGTGLMVIK